ncbi:MAG: PAS domain-containing protein [Ideonella sp.]|nr:PAS domain-containing protein [Ideonella sp.]MCC7456161.1 PAS domain-containing protein [Nitrospira sp.]
MSDDFSVPDAVAAPVLALDASGIVRGANAAFCVTSGRAAAELLGEPLTRLCDADDAAHVTAFALVAAACREARTLDGVPLLLHDAAQAPWPVRVSLRSVGAARWLTLADRRAEQRADHLQELLDLAQRFGRLGIWERDLTTMRGRWDRHMHRFWGLSDDLPTPDFAQATRFILDEDRQALESMFLASTQVAGSYSHRYRVCGADGVVRHLHSQWVVRNGPDGHPAQALGAMVDDSEIWRMARTVDEARSQLELALQLGGIVMWRHDLASNRLLYEDAGWRVLGMTPRREGLSLEEARALIHPDDRPRVQAAMASALRASGPTQMDARYRHASGRWLDVLTRCVTQRDAQGTPVSFIGVAIDMTEQRSRERALREAHERSALATSALGLGTWDHDAVSGRGHWDEQMWKLRGREPDGRDEPTMDERLSWLHPDDVEPMRQEITDSIREGRPGRNEYRVLWPDGSVHWLASRSVPFLDAEGREVRRIGINWDVTEARQAEQTRQERLLAQRESQAKSRFLARMSHELRTPLNAVIGFAQLLLAEPSLSDNGAALGQLLHIRAAGEHLLALVNDVLDLSSLDTGEIRLELQAVELATLYDAAAPMVAALAASNGVQLQRGELPGTVLADPTRLRQVLLNLLTNAVKYNRHGGTVQVESRSTGDTVSLQVRDSGRGMTPEQLAHVFEPFNRLGLHGQGIEGTGIGLAIVKANVERMGGTVQVHSTLGVGSEFEVRLPVANGIAVAQAAARSRPPTPQAIAKPAGSRHGRLLYIEDNPVNALIVRGLVAQRGNLTLDEADDGRSGIDSARAQRPDLILVDMQLPDIDGLEVLRRLRADPSTATIPCIALSANAMPDDIQRALGAGFADYWTKPLDFRVFLSALDTLFGKRN